MRLRIARDYPTLTASSWNPINWDRTGAWIDEEHGPGGWWIYKHKTAGKYGYDAHNDGNGDRPLETKPLQSQTLDDAINELVALIQLGAV